MNTIKFIKKTVLAVGLTLALLVLGVSAYTYFYKDKIIDLFVAEINKNLSTPVDVGEIDISIFSNFPAVSIEMINVTIREAIKGSTADLAKAKKLFFSFNIWHLLQGQYVIDDVTIEQAEIWLRVNRYGQNNYTITKTNTESSKEVKFDLNKIWLKNVLVHYSNIPKKQTHDFFTEGLNAGLNVVGSSMNFRLKGDLFVKNINVNKVSYLKDKDFDIDGLLVYDNKNQRLTIEPSLLELGESQFSLEGFYSFFDRDSMSIKVSSEKTDVKTLLSLLPASAANKLSGYESEGDVYFRGQLNGELYENISPSLSLEFGFNDASVYHPGFKKSLEQLNLTGSLEMASVTDPSSASLVLDNFTCELDGESLTGSLKLSDFNKKYLELTLAGLLDMSSFLEFYPIKEFSNTAGTFDFDIDIKGHLTNLEKSSTSFSTAGEVSLQDVGFDYSHYKLPFRQFNGTLLFNNSDLAISDFTGAIGSSDFRLNGIFRNILATIFSNKQGINIEADLNSSHLNLDELLSGSTKIQNGNTDYSFSISPTLELDFDCKINELQFRRFQGNNISGHLEVKDQLAVLANIKTTTIGGDVLLNAHVDASKNNEIRIKSESRYDGLEIDSLFYVFENFNQTFLVDRHLHGQVVAEVTTEMLFDSKLNLDMPSLKSVVKIAIKNGELNDFEPMQRLSKYVEEGSLARLRFSDLQNTIVIEDEIIRLPQMEIRSNVSNILIRGTHTFDQEIEYFLRVPLTRMDKVDKDEAYGAVEDDGTGVPNLFLIINGTTSDYKIIYDKKAVGKKIKDDFKKEGQELKDVFKNQGKKEETIELEEDDYFDFEEDTIKG